MKLTTYEFAAEERIGAVIGSDDTVVDLAEAQTIVASAPSPHLASMQTLIDGGNDALELVRSLAAEAPVAATHPLSDVRLLAPLQPRQMRDFLCFEEHLLNARAQAKNANDKKAG